MNQNERILIKLLSSAIRDQEYVLDENIGSADWESIYKEAVAHQVHTLIYPAVNKLGKRYQPSEDLLSAWKKATFFYGIEILRNQYKMGEVFKAFYDAGIQVIALKGLVLNQLYPQPEFRIMGDADILVKRNDVDKASEILTGLGYLSERDNESKHIKFFMPGHITIELHRQLIEYDCIKNENDFEDIVWLNPRQADIVNGTVLAMEWSVQLLHICLHMAFHIIYGGFGLRQLCDLVLLVELKQNEIDWSFVVEKSKLYGIEKFIQALFKICDKLFDMKIPNQLTGYGRHLDNYTDKLIADIIIGGDFGLKDKKRRSANIILKNSNSSSLYNTNKLYQYILLLFPSYNQLRKRKDYRYVNQSALLIPIAWCHRIIRILFRKDLDWQTKAAIFNDNGLVDMAKDRDEFLKWFGLR